MARSNRGVISCVGSGRGVEYVDEVVERGDAALLNNGIRCDTFDGPRQSQSGGLTYECDPLLHNETIREAFFWRFKVTHRSFHSDMNRDL